MALAFWERVNSRIKTQPTKQETVAAQAGVSYQTFRGWITKDIFPRADEACAIARALNTTVEELVTGQDASALPPGFLADCRLLQKLGDLGPVADLAEIRAQKARDAAEAQAKNGAPSA